jgi:hypothetical protein
MLPRHGELRGGDRYDRLSMAWVRADEWQVRQWEREDRAFARKANQGELSAPMVIADTTGSVRGVQSMVDGRHYDSKSSLRRHYRDAGVIEVGNEPVRKGPRYKDPHQERKIEGAIHKAFNRMGIPPV